jgi:hypothetical protein
MERLVLFLCGLWFWLTRKHRVSQYNQVASSLHSARLYLVEEFSTRASTRDRGALLPNQIEAITILDRQMAHVKQTSRRFQTLAECCRLATEELAEPGKAA